MTKDTGGPAFPMPGGITKKYNPHHREWEEVGFSGHSGMSIRDYFAIHAPTNEIGKYLSIQMPSGTNITFKDTDYEQARYKYADAMLKERNK